jgi:hypothetical protein
MRMSLRNSLLGGAAVAAAAVAAVPAEAGYDVYNPYSSSQNSFDRLAIRRLVVFGDSYSDPSWAVQDNWAEQLKASGQVRLHSNYAVAGATAFNGPTNNTPTNSLRMQVDRFLGSGPSYALQDLTVVYIGYNDINRLNGLVSSKSEYTRAVDRLRGRGATNKNRRMLLVMEHNMRRDPARSSRTSANLSVWNQYVANLANSRSNVIAVDLYTAFERVYADPQRYGFANVTTPDPSRSAIDALYYDSHHFGLRGHRLIQQVFRHYLSRGWDWANTLQTASQTVAALNRDLDDDLVFDTYSLDMADSALGIVPFGELADMEDPWDDRRAEDSGPVMGFAPETAGPADGGVAVSWRLGEQTRMAFVVGGYDADNGGDSAFGASETETSSRASGIVLDHRIGKLSLRSTLLYSDDSYTTRSYDSFVDDSVSARFGGSTLRVGQKLAWDWDAGPLTLTPWAELSYQRQDTDEFTMADPFVSDLRYDAAAVAETSAAFGLSLRLLPIDLGELGWLRLQGNIGYTHDLTADDYRVSIREAAVNGYTQRETVANEPDRSIQLGLGAGWEVTPTLALSAGYHLDTPVRTESGREPDHRLTAAISLRF